MTLIRREDRKFARQAVPMVNLTVEDVFANIMQMKRANCPTYTTESKSDFGVQLLHLLAVLFRWNGDIMEGVRNDAYLSTANNRQAVRRLCEMIGYTLSEAGAAAVDVTFDLESGHPEFTIAKGIKVATVETPDVPAIIFETAADKVCTVGLTDITTACVQGTTVSAEVLGSSDNAQGQRFPLSRSPVVWQSETVEVLNGDVWEEWTRVDSLVLSSGVDKVYRVEVDEDNIYSIVFGDGVFGMIPQRGPNNIRATYRMGGGVIGNVGALTIVELISSVSYIDAVSNVDAASGGTDRETIDHARMFAPGAMQTLDRIVTVDDVQTLAESYVSASFGAIAKAKAVEVGGLTVSVLVVPSSGGYPSTAFKSELQAYLTVRKMVCASLQVMDPAYHPVDITANIWTKAAYQPAEVLAEVRRQLIGHISPTYQDPESGLYPHGFGRNVYLSDLFRIIDSTPGVDYCDVTVPTSDVIVTDNRIVDVGDISLQANIPSGGTEFLDVKSDSVARATKKPYVRAER
jgi:hypothetical protein